MNNVDLSQSDLVIDSTYYVQLLGAIVMMMILNSIFYL